MEAQDLSMAAVSWLEPKKVAKPFPCCGLHKHVKSKIQTFQLGLGRWVGGVLENLPVQFERQPEKVFFCSIYVMATEASSPV